jgi:hypothetical protein
MAVGALLGSLEGVLHSAFVGLPVVAVEPTLSLLFLTSGVCSGRGSESNLFDQLSVRRLKETTPISSFLLGARSLQSEGCRFCNREITAPRGKSKSELKVGFRDFVEENSEHHEIIKSVKDVAEPTRAPSSVPSATPSISMMPPQTPTVMPNPLSLAMSPRKISVGPSISSGPTVIATSSEPSVSIAPSEKYRWSLSLL